MIFFFFVVFASSSKYSLINSLSSVFLIFKRFGFFVILISIFVATRFAVFLCHGLERPMLFAVSQLFCTINFANDHSKMKTKRKLNEWFDDECRDFKKTVNKNRKRFQEAIRNNYPNTELIRLKSEYFNSLKIFNKIRKRKENNYWKIKKSI